MTESTMVKVFKRVQVPELLIPILKERHPHSCFMYNQVIKYPVLKNDLTFYTIGEEIHSDTWIVSCNIREDYGANYSVSAPARIITGEDQIPNEIKNCFSSCDAGISSDLVFNWDENMIFISAEKPISKMLCDISTNIKGNVTEIHPCILYYMEQEVAQGLEISHPENVKVRRLETKSQDDIDFILSSWNYVLPGSEIVVPKCFAQNPSAGVFLEIDGKEKCVSGVTVPGICLLSALYTLKEHRNKGYAKLTMKYCFREFANEGCIPCLTVEVKNVRSNQFHHQGLGMKVVSMVDGILVKKLEID